MVRNQRWPFLIDAIVLLLVALVALPVACAATLTAPMHSPGLAARFACPPGATLVVDSYQSVHDKAGRKRITGQCVDAQGKSVPRRELNESALVDGMALFYPRCAAILLLVAAIPWLPLRLALLRRAARSPK